MAEFGQPVLPNSNRWINFRLTFPPREASLVNVSANKCLRVPAKKSCFHLVRFETANWFFSGRKREIETRSTVEACADERIISFAQIFRVIINDKFSDDRVICSATNKVDGENRMRRERDEISEWAHAIEFLSIYKAYLHFRQSFNATTKYGFR